MFLNGWIGMLVALIALAGARVRPANGVSQTEESATESLDFSCAIGTSDLDRLTATNLFALSEKAGTAKDLTEQALAFNRRTMGTAYETVGRKNERWDDSAKAYLDRFAEIFADMADGGNEIREKGAALLADGCDDPLVLYCHGVALASGGKKTAGRACIERGIRNLYASGYPAHRKAFAATRLAKLTAFTRPARTKHLEVAFGYLLEAIRNRDYREDESRLLYLHLQNFWDMMPLPDRKRFAEAVAALPEADPWLADLLVGRYHLEEAWQAMPIGWRPETHEEKKRSWDLHREEARRYLTAAYERKPEYPEAAAHLIRVAMTGGTRRGEDEIFWFQRAVGAQFDYEEAYLNMLWSLQPRWCGSHEAKLQFGIACGETRRFDTIVPYQLVKALLGIKRDDDDSYAFWRKADAYEPVAAVLQGYAEAAPARRNWYRSLQAGIAWRMGRLDEARQLLDESGWELSADALALLDASPDDLYRNLQLAETGSPAQEAMRLDREGDTAAALALLRESLAQAGGNERKAAIFRTTIAQLELEQAFQTGDWVDLRFDDGFSGWQAVHGTWRVAADGALTGRPGDDRLGIVCRARFGNRFEVRGTLVFEGDEVDQNLDGGLLFSQGEAWVNPSCSFLLHRYQHVASLGMEYYAFNSQLVPLARTNDFRVEIWDSMVATFVNGRLVHRKRLSDLGGAESDTRLWLGSGSTCPCATLVFGGLQIRKLSEQPLEKDQALRQALESARGTLDAEQLTAAQSWFGDFATNGLDPEVVRQVRQTARELEVRKRLDAGEEVDLLREWPAADEWDIYGGVWTPTDDGVQCVADAGANLLLFPLWIGDVELTGEVECRDFGKRDAVGLAFAATSGHAPLSAVLRSRPDRFAIDNHFEEWRNVKTMARRSPGDFVKMTIRFQPNRTTLTIGEQTIERTYSGAPGRIGVGGFTDASGVIFRFKNLKVRKIVREPSGSP